MLAGPNKTALFGGAVRPLFSLDHVTGREHCHVAPGEGRLLMRDSVQRQMRIGNDPRATVAGNLAVQFDAIRYVQPIPLGSL
ncbi:hypothetical protein H9643_20980 [Ochrobactrum sp. Sa2BUA5]|nr:hypothetical protein [Ochrobactrum gallinarum]MDH7793662.1 hypothetical protein [Ochrobactrum sp. AN78]